MISIKSFILLTLLAYQTWADTTVTYTNANVPGYKITVVDKNSGVPATTVTNLRFRFWNYYTTMASYFNPMEGVATDITLVLDPSYTASPATTNLQTITINSNWIKSNPNDVDVMVHELMNSIQQGNGGWGAYRECSDYVITGLQDFARDRYGTSNSAQGWSLPAYSSSQNYTNGGKVTGAFFKYLTKTYADLPSNLLNSCYEGDYVNYEWQEDELWQGWTGKTIKALWTQYSQNK